MKDLEKYREKLLDLRHETLDSGALSVKADKTGLSHEVPDEDAQPLSEMGQVIASNRNRNRSASLARIDAALARLQNDPGSFGECSDCGEDIPAKRLDLMPFAEYCAKCQGVRDQADKPAGRRHLTDYR